MILRNINITPPVSQSIVNKIVMWRMETLDKIIVRWRIYVTL